MSDIVKQQHQAEEDGELDTWAYESILDHEVTNGSALMPYREVDALALVTNSAGLQARPENTYVGPPGPYVQVMNSNLCSDPARAYPEHTYGTNGDSSPMSEEIAFRIW